MKLGHDEIIELIGAFALDAVSGDEAAIIRSHLAGCPRCAAEVQSYQEIAGRLANAGGDAPEHLWDRIAAHIEKPQGAGAIDLDAPVVRIVSAAHAFQARSTRRRWSASGARPWVAGAAAAAIVLIAALGVQVGRLDHRVDKLQVASQKQALTQAAQAALSNPQARRVTLTAAHRTTPAVAELVILPSGTAFVVNDRLPSLESNKTYQLWGKVGDQLISLGLLGDRPVDVPFRVDPNAAFVAFAVTVEHAGGVVQSTHVPVAVSATLSA